MYLWTRSALEAVPGVGTVHAGEARARAAEVTCTRPSVTLGIYFVTFIPNVYMPFLSPIYDNSYTIIFKLSNGFKLSLYIDQVKTSHLQSTNIIYT